MICIVVGARPNFVKMAPVILELSRRQMPFFVVHTGQHYDREMSELFFEELSLPKPDLQLSVGSGTHAEQTARILLAFEPVCLERKPALVLVGGDVNSTLAAAMTASKCGIPVGHVEAGLRSFDRAMPEEINRVLTDHLSELLFTTEDSANRNLKREGIAASSIHFVGNTMIDTLRLHLEKALEASPWSRYGLLPQQYGVVTLHRPSNLEDEETFRAMSAAIAEISEKIPFVFPVHPRTRAPIEKNKDAWRKVILLPPAGYLDFLGLIANARLVLTDSGGIQEETTALGVPCVTLRENTERPVTIKYGTNRLAGKNQRDIVKIAEEALSAKRVKPRIPPLWDGKSAKRIVDVLENRLSRRKSFS